MSRFRPKGPLAEKTSKAVTGLDGFLETLVAMRRDLEATRSSLDLFETALLELRAEWVEQLRRLDEGG